MLRANPDTAGISWTVTLKTANERVERALWCNLRNLVLTTPAKLIDFLQVFRKVFTVQKAKLAVTFGDKLGFIAVLEL